MADFEHIMAVRLIIADLDTGENQLFGDDQIGAFLDLNDSNVRLAAADALETIAVSEVLISKKIRTQDLTTDGAAVSAELRQMAKVQRDLAAKAAKDADDALWSGFDVVDTVKSSRRPEATEYPIVWGL